MIDERRIIPEGISATCMFSGIPVRLLAACAAVSCHAGRLLSCMAALLALQPAWAESVEVRVLDRTGKPVPEVVVTLSDQRRGASPSSSRELSMTMDQVNMRFVPELLVVPVGANVAFPNSDTVSHQVYSFSPAKSFQLSLYKKGSANPPVLFDKPGLVVLGCNIHDEMVAYIFVTAVPLYGKTDAGGRIVWNNVNSGPATIAIWSPLLADADVGSRQLEIQSGSSQNAPQSVEFKLTKPLRGSPYPRARRSDWAY